jgi:photosystem II stability/assembly factor-like uncharacterized protein
MSVEKCALVLVTLLLAGAQLLNGSVPALGQEQACPVAGGWTQLAAPPPVISPSTGQPFGVGSIAAAANEQGFVLYAGGYAGLHRSTDCGGSWEPVPVSPPAGLRASSPRVWAVAVDPAGRIYVSKQAGPILPSSDGGATWSGVQMLSNAIGAAVAPGAPSYAILLGRFLTPTALLRTTAGGISWERVALAAASVVAADALDPDIVYLGYGPGAGSLTGALYRQSVDGQARHQLAQFEAHVSALAMSEDASRFWLGTGDGWLSRSVDRGDHWAPIAPVPAGSAITGLAVSPADPMLVFAVAGDGSIWV